MIGAKSTKPKGPLGYLRGLALGGFALAAAALTTSAGADSLAPNLPPNAPSPVYGQTNAQLDSMLQQLGKELEKRGPFDGLAFAENHCWPQGSQLPVAEQTVALFKKFHISAIATEYPDKYNRFFDEHILVKSRDVDAEKAWIKLVADGMASKDCQKYNGLTGSYVGALEGQADIDAARRFAANGMVWFASDYNWYNSEEYKRQGKMKEFYAARLEESAAAKQLSDGMGEGRVAIVRGARHLLQYAPTALRPQFEKYGRKIVTVAFDNSGHDVKDWLAETVKEGFQASPPDIVMDWKNGIVYPWPKPQADLGTKQGLLVPARNDNNLASVPATAATP